MRCNDCTGPLIRVFFLGENIWQCESCLAIWFILQATKPKQDNIGEPLACLRQVQSHAYPRLSWQEWIETAATVMKSINVANPGSEE